MTVLAVVPARGGSKGIPRKNVAPLNGKPLIVHTLHAASRSKTVTDILVSTDDAGIAAICEAEGVSVPYRRPEALAGDDVGMVETVLHAVGWWQAQRSGEPELIVVLQPTSPLRSASDIDGTVNALRSAGRESAISVHEMAEHPMECIRLAGDSWSMLERPTPGAVRRQDYQSRYYFINGAVYVTTPAFLRRHRAFMREDDQTALYVMDAVRGVDIDDPDDLDLAEAILKHPRLSKRVSSEFGQS